ncbi:15749_t:CDS:2 [Rhizophagus irregularis]|nr:15749_t:CDS:2 [Rhizophagus irregularis]
METKMQNSIRYSTISTTMVISEMLKLWINKAICQIDKLLEDIEIRNRKKDIEKEKKNSRISDNGNHQHATPRNHKDNDLKEKRKRFKRRMPHTTKARQVRYKNI